MDIPVILTRSFERWLKTLSYAPGTIYASVRCVNDFFFYLKPFEITDPGQIHPDLVNDYYRHLQTRANKRRSGGLSENYIISNISALKRFGRYLQETGRADMEISLRVKAGMTGDKTVLTPGEVRSLYRACTNDILGIRDRAILGIYYGCGLRRSEGLALDAPDLQLKEKRLHVRKGKNYRQRYVPVTTSVKEDLENYLYVSREKILGFKDTRHQALLLSMRCSRMHGNSVIIRLQKLAKVANIQKQVGLHTLRHSIATHLLQSGMTLEEVSLFLGHASLESTQVYTHLASEGPAMEDPG